jgi:hypothetical protein
MDVTLDAIWKLDLQSETVTKSGRRMISGSVVTFTRVATWKMCNCSDLFSWKGKMWNVATRWHRLVSESLSMAAREIIAYLKIISELGILCFCLFIFKIDSDYFQISGFVVWKVGKCWQETILGRIWPARLICPTRYCDLANLLGKLAERN